MLWLNKGLPCFIWPCPFTRKIALFFIFKNRSTEDLIFDDKHTNKLSSEKSKTFNIDKPTQLSNQNKAALKDPPATSPRDQLLKP